MPKIGVALKKLQNKIQDIFKVKTDSTILATTLSKNKSNKISQASSKKEKITKDLRIGKVPLKRIKQNKIDQLSTDVMDLETQIEQLLAQKSRLEQKIEILNRPDSVRLALRKEIIDYNKPSQAEMPIPVGMTDIDELIRNLVLLDKIPSNTNLTVRPYYTETKLNYSNLLKIIDSSISYDPMLIKAGSLIIKKLPIQLGQKLNTHHPYGGNDGALSYSKGDQYRDWETDRKSVV